MATNIVEVDSLSITYQQKSTVIRAVNGVSMVIREGECVGIVGESGSGKSTLSRSLLGLLPPGVSRVEEGRIVIAGQDVTRFSQRQWESMRGNPVAMVFQDPSNFLNPVMRIGRQIGESVRRHDHVAETDERVGELLELVRLPRTAAHLYPHELSGGMQQRAVLAIALGCRPRVLVADEPTTALDVTIQSEILALLEELRRRLGMTMLLISHDLGVVSTSCERIYVMYAGRLIEWGEARAVFDQPAHPYTIGLMRSAEARRNRRGRFDTIGGDVPNLARLSPGCPFKPRCDRATEVCVEMPAPADYGQDVEHRLRCWHAGEAAPGSEDRR